MESSILILPVATLTSLFLKKHRASFDGSPSDHRYRGDQGHPYDTRSLDSSSSSADDDVSCINVVDDDAQKIQSSNSGSQIETESKSEHRSIIRDGIASAWVMFR